METLMMMMISVKGVRRRKQRMEFGLVFKVDSVLSAQGRVGRSGPMVFSPLILLGSSPGESGETCDLVV
jgi:hypothetical protein